MKKYILLASILAFGTVCSFADTSGGITPDMMEKIKSAYKDSPTDKALHNAIAANNIDNLAVNAENKNSFNYDFSHRVKSKGITDQKSSGRCWLFTGLNVLRARMLSQHDLPKLELSQNYNFFWDQLEKANLFLQGIIDTADKPMDDKTVEWLFQHPLSDGGQYTGLSDNIMKYGIVPADVMLETYSSNNTAKMRTLLGWKLKEWGL